MNDLDKRNVLQEESVVDHRTARRHFLGKGIKAAPFVVTLASQPALGATCFTPSRSLSRNTSVSQQGLYGECTGAESAGNYKTHQTPGASAYHWPTAVPPTTPFHPLFKQGTTPSTLFTMPVPGGNPRSMTLGEVLTTGAGQDTDKVAKHLIGAYLNKMGGNNAVIPDAAITVEGILTIWQEYVTKGHYEPFAGVEWDAEDIKTYLKTNGLVG